MGMNKKCKWVIEKTFRFCGFYLVMYSVILTLATGIGFATNLVNKSLVNELAASRELGQISTVFIGLAIIYMCLYFFQRVNGFIITFGSNFFKHKVDMMFHRIFMWKSVNEPQVNFLNKEFMDRYSFVGNNTGKISSFFQNLLTVVCVNFGVIVWSVALFIIYEPILIIYVILISIGTFWVNGYVSKKEYELDKQQVEQQRFHDYYKGILTEKRYAKEIRVYGIAEFFFDKWSRVYEKLRVEKLVLEIKRVNLENIYSYVRFFCRGIAVAFLLFGTYRGRYDIGTFVLMFGLIESCANHVDNLSFVLAKGTYKDVKYLSDYYDYVGNITNEQIKEILNSKLENVVLPYGEFKELELKNVSFKYDSSNDDAVRNISLKIKRGEIVSILGYNGSGKTTLSKIMSGCFCPKQGSIRINGTEISEENRDSLLYYYGITPQEYSHFSVSVKEYVGLGKIELMNQQEELQKAYNRAEINEFLSKYEAGDETQLGKEYDEQGVDLSGGEWQKLAIASAYMGTPEILLMDEPSASIDPLKEAEMINALAKNLKGETVVLISHRIGFARLADRIIMMKKGEIVEEGSHDELLSQNGYYAELFNAQKKIYESKGE